MARNNNKEFSKTLLIQESILIWIITFFCLALAAFCVIKNYTGTLPWFASMIALPWGAYGTSAACYYSKSKAENTKDGVKFESIMANIAAASITESEEQSFEESSDPPTADYNNIDIYYGI